ncbi:MAG: asparagine synthase (glutamine-hydrolyzing) [Pyrinomonadaceae bacterium]
MCGISGFVNSGSNCNRELLVAMCDTMRHRGPDSAGYWFGEESALGMRRLAIIDVASGNQPFYNRDKSIVVVMNGELYNYREIREQLIEKGYKFETDSDTEILPHLYEEYGASFVEHLNGMFAIAIWDEKLKQLLIARDRFGEKPLYYGKFDDNFIFASEPKVLLAHPNVSRDVDREALEQYISYDYVPAPRSIFKNIYKLPAAHLLKYRNGEIQIKEYWKLTFRKREQISFEDAEAELKSLLSDSVKIRMISDVPLGVFLSGGIDSSTVAAFAQKNSSKRIKTFSIGFEEDTFDESKFARLVANHIGSEHFEDRLTVETAKNLITEIGNWLDEPLADASLIPTYLLSRFVSNHVTVSLGGDGGDELFAGYPMYFAHKVARVYEGVPRFVRTGIVRPLVSLLPTGTGNLSLDFKAKRFVRSDISDEIVRHHSWFGSFSLEEAQRLLVFPSRGDIYADARELLESSDAEDLIEQMQLLDMKNYLSEDILTKVDRASMAVSLEARAPFLDKRIAEFAASIPSNYKLRGRTTKYILKKSVENLIPKEVIYRPKKGFGIPVAKWLNGALNPLVHELLSPQRLKSQELFDPVYVSKLVSDHENGIANNYKQIWTLLVFELWYENFLKI